MLLDQTPRSMLYDHSPFMLHRDASRVSKGWASSPPPLSVTQITQNAEPRRSVGAGCDGSSHRTTNASSPLRQADKIIRTSQDVLGRVVLLIYM